ncbi:MAG: glycosyltransferase family 4 protein [Chlorobi bacterium]|nr:glycosyltransferase family 4 protein [Chlorobiota bacterium]
MKTGKRVAICTTSDVSTDYRLYKMAVSLSEKGFIPYYVTRSRKGYANRSEKFRVKVMRLLFEKGPVFYLEYNIRLFLSLLMSPPDVVFSVDLDTLPATRFFRLFFKRPLIFDSHEYFPEVPELQHRPFVKGIWQKLEKLCVPGIDYGITVCQPIADIYKGKYGKSFSIVRNLPMKAERTVEPRQHSDEFTLIYQGAVNIGRGLKESVECLTLINDVRLIIVGDGDIFQDIKVLVEELNLTDRVTMTGRIPFHEIKKYTRQADLGLCVMENIGLNYYYSLPNRIFDYMQCSVPVLAVDFPEIKKVVEGYDIGYCVSEMEPEYLAKVIGEIRNDKKRLEKWRINSDKAAKELVWENEKHALFSILDDINSYF